MKTLSVKVAVDPAADLKPWIEAAIKARQHAPDHPCHDYWSERSRVESRKVVVVTRGD